MIIWINGPFGVGKTTVANELHKKIQNSYIYDPENVGEFIWDNSPESISRKGDFQNISIWRDFNYQMLKYIHDNYHGTIIVPMTLVNKQYYNEIVSRLINEGISVCHFVLLADRVTIIDRLKDRDGSSNQWAVNQLDKCLEAYEKEIDGIKINTDNKSIDDIVNIIIEKNL